MTTPKNNPAPAIDVGEGYRQLTEDEVLNGRMEGDEFYNQTTWLWHETDLRFKPACNLIYLYRRKLAPTGEKEKCPDCKGTGLTPDQPKPEPKGGDEPCPQEEKQPAPPADKNISTPKQTPVEIAVTGASNASAETVQPSSAAGKTDIPCCPKCGASGFVRLADKSEGMMGKWYDPVCGTNWDEPSAPAESSEDSGEKAVDAWDESWTIGLAIDEINNLRKELAGRASQQEEIERLTRYGAGLKLAVDGYHEQDEQLRQQLTNSQSARSNDSRRHTLKQAESLTRIKYLEEQLTERDACGNVFSTGGQPMTQELLDKIIDLLREGSKQVGWTNETYDRSSFPTAFASKCQKLLKELKDNQ